MIKKGIIVKEGRVTEALPDTMFRILLDDETKAIAQISGRLRKFHIRILPGDRVRIEFSVYDLSRGRIVTRL